MQVRLKDIAKRTGYSINTVSRALLDNPRISSATRAQIKTVAKEMGYIHNSLAGSMRSNRSYTIGVVSADSSNPFFAEVIVGIEEAARKSNYHILLINTEEDAANEREAVKLLRGRQVDGLMIMPVYDDPKNLQMYKNLRVPYMFVGRKVKGIDQHSILYEDRSGQKKVIEHLLNKGHERILYISGPDNVSNTFERLQGYYEAYKEKGCEVDESYIVSSTGHIEDGYTKVNHAFHRGLKFTAVACFNDLLAMGALKSLYENSFSVPEDVEVFGFDNLYMSQFMQPRLSTVDLNKQSLGSLAFKELKNHIEDEKKPYMTLYLKPRLILRETTRA